MNSSILELPDRSWIRRFLLLLLFRFSVTSAIIPAIKRARRPQYLPPVFDSVRLDTKAKLSVDCQPGLRDAAPFVPAAATDSDPPAAFPEPAPGKTLDVP